MNSFASIFLQPLNDFFFAISCFHCGGLLKDGEQRICSHCWNSLSVVKENDYTLNVLQDRFAAGGSIDECVALYYFEKGKLLQTLAHSLKYEEITAFGFELGKRLSVKLHGKAIDYIIPVPLNKRKERERGYNQSDYIADGISASLNIPALKTILMRNRYTESQTRLNADERKENIADAFSLASPQLIKGKTIVLVDDIITTGSTIQEAAKILKVSGAGIIIAASAGVAKLGEDRQFFKQIE